MGRALPRLDTSVGWPRCDRCGIRHTGRCPRVGYWLIAGTPFGGAWPYPCRCGERRTAGQLCSIIWCPCAGRVDLQHVPAGCCGHRVRPHHVAAALRAAQ